jgi:hypothetical protein
MKRFTDRAGRMAQIDTKWYGDEIIKRAEVLKTKSIRTIGMVVMGEAKQLCAVNYGYLAASIQTASNTSVTKLESPKSYQQETPPAGHQVDTFRDIEKPTDKDEVYVGTAVDYGPYVEYGTIKSIAQPFLRPALDMARGKVPQIVTTEGRKEFGEYLK